MKLRAREGIIQKKKALPITQEQEEDMWEKNFLGWDTPQKFNRTMVYLLSINLGLRGGQEIRQLKWGENSQITVIFVDGDEVLQYKENFSKTNQCGIKDHHVQPKIVRVYQNSNVGRCIVRHFKQFSNLRPLKDTTGAFFLQPNTNWSSCGGNKWFNNSPLGHNTLSMMIKSLMEAAGFDGTFSNHSGRRTAVTRIMSATGDKELAKKVTGHRSDSILSYNDIPNKKLKMVSDILSNIPLKHPSMSYSSSDQHTETDQRSDECSPSTSQALLLQTQFSEYAANITNKCSMQPKENLTKPQNFMKITLPNGCILEIPMN